MARSCCTPAMVAQSLTTISNLTKLNNLLADSCDREIGGFTISYAALVSPQNPPFSGSRSISQPRYRSRISSCVLTYHSTSAGPGSFRKRAGIADLLFSAKFNLIYLTNIVPRSRTNRPFRGWLQSRAYLEARRFLRTIRGISREREQLLESRRSC